MSVGDGGSHGFFRAWLDNETLEKKEEMCTSLRAVQLQFKIRLKSGYGQVRTWLRELSGIRGGIP